MERLGNHTTSSNRSFYEAIHLEGDVDMIRIIQLVVDEQQKRDERIPMRPDHGHKMLDDLHKQTNSGNSAIGRLRELAELRGSEFAILRKRSKHTK